MANNLLDKTQDQLLKYALKYYKINCKRACNISDPKLLSEKIQWYTFFYKNPLCPYIVDKVTFKDYVKEKIGEGYTIPLIASWKSVDEFEKDWWGETLPKEFCLKSNLQSDGKCIRIIHDKDSVDFAELKKEISEWLKPENTNMNSLARNFYMSTPQVLAEEYMSNFENLLCDYKFFCFEGNPYCMYVAENDFENSQYPITFYRLDWTRIDVQYGQHQTKEFTKPNHYEEMIEIAKKLSKGFPFVRVDFFDTEQKLYVAELTFNPGGGFFNFNPISFDREMGDLFVIPKI